MNFFKRNIGFVVPVLFGLLSAFNLWEAIHNGRFFQYVAAGGFMGSAVLFFISQIHASRKSTGSAE